MKFLLDENLSPNNITKRQTTEQEKIFRNDISDKVLISKICEELLKENKNINNPLKSEQRT